jgi:hypothetical protein
MKENFNLAAIIEELEEQKRMIMSVVQTGENTEEVDAGEVKIKVKVVKLKVMEELKVIQQMLNDLGDKTKEVVDTSQDDLQESWDAAKKVMANAEDKVAEIFKK